MRATAVSLADAPSLHGKEALIFPLKDAYDRAILAQPQDDRDGVLHPSAVGMCMRRGVYELRRESKEQKFDARSLEIFALGHKVHDLIQGRIEKQLERVLAEFGALGYHFHPELKYDPETDELFQNYLIGGTTDGVLEIWGEGWRQRAVIEIKSIGSKGYAALRRPKSDHLMQAHLYAYRFDCPIIYIWYFCKDTSESRVFVSTFDDSVFEQAMERMTLQYDHFVAGTLPDREEGWLTCKSCSYQKQCQPAVLKSKKGKEASRVPKGKQARIRR